MPMDFSIADTFTDSLARLTGDEQKIVKTTAFDLQLDPVNPGMQFHKLDKAKDKNFWSLRVSADLRLIVHKSETSLLLCYVDHHDKAYHWAERRKLETHPKTGAAQLVELRETIKEITVPKYVDDGVRYKLHAKPPLFATVSDDDLLGYGVPIEWLADVRRADEDSILEIAGHLPAEAAEALLNLATGVTPPVAAFCIAGADPFAHPDAQRRFRVMANVEELAQALEYPWEKWTIFLHPAQRQLVERDYNGPARVAGSAGTGKTIVALHRAVFLARANPDSRILLTTFSETLSNALRTKLRRLISHEPRLGERLEVHAINAIGQRLYELNAGRVNLASREVLRELMEEASRTVDHKFSLHFLLTEWEQVVDAWQLETWEAYRDVARLGRKTRLAEKPRLLLWSIFEHFRSALKARNLTTRAAMFTRLAASLAAGKNPPFDFVVVDEAQDISVAQLRFLAALGGGRANSLFFAGDLGQRIFQQPFSWKSLGVDIRGRSTTLHVNYRTSHQIRTQADRLLAPEVSDVDGNTEERRGTVSVFNGVPPEIMVLDSPEDETAAVAKWLSALKTTESILPHEIGVFVRAPGQLERASNAVQQAGLSFKVLDEQIETISGYASIGTMHLAKGLEFRAVVVMACDDEIIPLQERIETVGDDADLEDVYNTERQLLYVACTRARDHLLVTGVAPASEFLDDLRK
jgi:mRNA-degrading endonuclease RelE of RelBE toxin-antitoxin system